MVITELTASSRRTLCT